MTITNGYCTLAEAKAALRLTDSVDDSLIEKAIEGASRRIDGYCNRFFYQKSATVDLYTRFPYQLAIPELASSTITLSTDDAGDLSFATTWSASEYLLDPTDTAITGDPYTRILATGTKTFPLSYQPQRPVARLVGTFGWPAVPDDVREACVLLSIRGFARYNAALGVIGFADMAVQVRAVDPDVRDLLAPYKKLTVA